MILPLNQLGGANESVAKCWGTFFGNIFDCFNTLSLPYHATQRAVAVTTLSEYPRSIRAAEALFAGAERCIETSGRERSDKVNRTFELVSNRSRELRETMTDTMEEFLSGLCRVLPESLQQLLQQSIVIAWSCLEVLSSDLLIQTVNKKPALAKRLPLAKDEHLTLSELGHYNFDMSGSMGSWAIATARE
jgi:hypothetical protein